MACTLADVIQCVLPLETSSFDLRPAEYLDQFLSLLASLRGGRSRFVPLLLAKISETLPSMSIPLVPMPSHVKAEPGVSYLDATTTAVVDPFSSPSDSVLNPAFSNQSLAPAIPEITTIQYPVFPNS